MKSIYEFLFSEHLLNEHLLKSKTAASTQSYDYVDLGLPSDLLWARCNIGADEPTEYGDYFMWGSTEPNTNDDCGWKNCPFNNGHAVFHSSYFTSIKDKVCPNGILAAKYDAASVILGNDWRLPTKEDFEELKDNTKNEWVENYQDSKINGMVFTPVGFEANGGELGTELFIPASGFLHESRFYYLNADAYLWSSSLYASNTYYANNLHFDKYCDPKDISKRFYGFCLRAVKEK